MCCRVQRVKGGQTGRGALSSSGCQASTSIPLLGGHLVGATGCRILTTMLRELDRREARYGLETMCIGGGQGLAAVFERID